MVNGKPQLIFGDGQLPAQNSLKAGRQGQKTLADAGFAAFMPQEDTAATPHNPLQQFDARQALNKRLTKPGSARHTGPVTGRGDLTMLQAPQAPRGHSTLPLGGRPAFAAPSAVTLQAQGLGAFNAQGIAPQAAFGQPDLASYSLPPASAPKPAQGVLPGRPGLEQDPAPAPLAKVLESGKQSLKTISSLTPEQRGQLATTRRARAKEEPAAVMPFGQGEYLQASSHLLSGDSTQALLRAFNELAPAAERPSFGTFPGGQQAMAFSGRQGLGSLAARFESGSDGIAAIGYDRHGGTSYGKYQISSRAGTMKNFISYLDDKAPDIGKRLKAAGASNTGGRRGAMPNTWRQIAEEMPERFEKLQDEFIRTSHFEPAMQAVAQSTGVSFTSLPPALQEVVFSTAVQHGPAGAARIINRALAGVDPSKLQGSQQSAAFNQAGQDLIRQIYAIRAGQFGSSTATIQAAVKSRLKEEMRAALGMLTA